MINPWFGGMLLAIESSNVGALSIMRMMVGGRSASNEAKLVVDEEVSAMCEAGGAFLGGGTPNMIIGLLRERVASNARRLGVQPKEHNDQVAGRVNRLRAPDVAGDPSATEMKRNRETAVAKRAYHLWESHGYVHGLHDQDWRQAERELGFAAGL